MSERRYWRPETEKLLSDLERIRDAEMNKRMIRPVVIQVTEQERKQMEERFQHQMIQLVDFSNATSATVPNVTIEDLVRTIEECERQVALDKEAQEFLKVLERLTCGYEIRPSPLQTAMFDLWEHFRFRCLGERVTAEALAVYEPIYKNDEYRVASTG